MKYACIDVINGFNIIGDGKGMDEVIIAYTPKQDMLYYPVLKKPIYRRYYFSQLFRLFS
jgi:hypothetical protein